MKYYYVNKLGLAFLSMALIFLSCVFAFAQATEPTSIESAVTLLPTIYAAVKSGNYLLAGATLTLVLVFAVRQYLLPKLGLSASLLPLVSVVIGILSGAAVSIIGGASPAQAAMAMLSGPMASTLWSLAIKYFFDPEKLK